MLEELNLDLVGNSTVGEKLLLLSKEIRVEIHFWESVSHKLIIKTVEVDKLPKRKGVRRAFGRFTVKHW